jgi:hypothetical protein
MGSTIARESLECTVTYLGGAGSPVTFACDQWLHIADKDRALAAGLAKQVVRDDLHLDFRGALENLGQPGVPPVTLDRVQGGVAGPAEDLRRRVSAHPLSGRAELGGRLGGGTASYSNVTVGNSAGRMISKTSQSSE